MTRAEAKQLVKDNPVLAAELIVATMKLRDSVLTTKIPDGLKWSSKTAECLDAISFRLSLIPQKD